MAVSWRATCRQGSRPARPALYARAGDCGRRRQGPGKDALGRPEHALLDGGLGARKVERRARRHPAEALAGAGAVALALRWFRGDQQPSRPRQVLLETFVGALDRRWRPSAHPPAFVGSNRHARSMASAAGAAVVARATIPVESFRGEVILVAGDDDQPSSAHAAAIWARRRRHGLDRTVVVDPAAGHPVLLPGEPPKDTRRPYQVGGDRDAPRRPGRQAWPALTGALHLGPRMVTGSTFVTCS